jgi:hypothetical protein
MCTFEGNNNAFRKYNYASRPLHEIEFKVHPLGGSKITKIMWNLEIPALRHTTSQTQHNFCTQICMYKNTVV